MITMFSPIYTTHTQRLKRFRFIPFAWLLICLCLCTLFEYDSNDLWWKERLKYIEYNSWRCCERKFSETKTMRFVYESNFNKATIVENQLRKRRKATVGKSKRGWYDLVHNEGNKVWMNAKARVTKYTQHMCWCADVLTQHNSILSEVEYVCKPLTW